MCVPAQAHTHYPMISLQNISSDTIHSSFNISNYIPFKTKEMGFV